MKRLIVAAVLLVGVVLAVQGQERKTKRTIAEARRSGRPRISSDYKSETVDGVTWQYFISNGVAVVEAPARIVGPARAKVRLSAIPDSTDGTVIVPDSLGGCPVVRIGERALVWCKNMAKVVVPSSVTSIGAEAFDGCKSLSVVVLPDAVLSIEQGAFSYCTNLVSVTVPAGLTHIGKGAFQGCRRLAGFAIPTNCVSVGARAFAGCDALGEMKIPACVRKIGDGAFSGLQSFVVDEQNPTFRHDGGGSYDKTGTRMLGFPNTGIVVRISAAVTNISESACKDLGSAKSIEVDPENRFYKSVGGCLYDKNVTTLVRCPNVSQMKIPEGVKCIGPHAFEYLKDLANVDIPSSVVEIGESAFYGCRGLESVSIPQGVTNVGRMAFKSCESLKSITIPSTVKMIRRHAFSGCWGLKSVVIMPGVESIGVQAFIDCPQLASMRIPSSMRMIGRNFETERENLGAMTFGVGYTRPGPGRSMPSVCDELKIVADKGDEDRVHELLYQKTPNMERMRQIYGRRRKIVEGRGGCWRTIKVVSEEEWLGGKSPDKADKKK